MPRRTHDFYETPPHYVQTLKRHVRFDSEPYVIEPCVGDGAISRYFPDGITNDIDPARPATFHMDATKAALWRRLSQRCDTQDLMLMPWIISNPPFNAAFGIISLAELFFPNVPIIMLLRLSFLEPVEERREWLEAHPPDQLIVLPRYSFRLNDQGKRQTDSVTCAWMCWNTGDTGIVVDGTRPA